MGPAKVLSAQAVRDLQTAVDRANRARPLAIRAQRRATLGAPAPVLVLVVQTAGEDGDEDSACGWKYTIYPLNSSLAEGEELAADLTPELRPTVNGSYTKAETGSVGLAYQVTEDDVLTWHLLCCAETLNTDTCDPA